MKYAAIFFISFLTLGFAHQEEPYRFCGSHFLGSYLDCDRQSIEDIDGLLHAMDEAIYHSKATVLNRTHYLFPGDGLTAVYLLSESHASIHTYPEYCACFVDLFTCGNQCSSEDFDAVLRSYLQPKKVNARIFLRDESIREIASFVN